LDLASEGGEDYDEEQEEEKDEFDGVDAVAWHFLLPFFDKIPQFGGGLRWKSGRISLGKIPRLREPFEAEDKPTRSQEVNAGEKVDSLRSE